MSETPGRVEQPLFRPCSGRMTVNGRWIAGVRPRVLSRSKKEPILVTRTRPANIPRVFDKAYLIL